MKLSNFGNKFTAKSGILELMEDLESVLTSKEKIYMLGGGNPAQLPAVNEYWQQRLPEIIGDPKEFQNILTVYDSAHGNLKFTTALSDLLNREYGWDLTPENIAITNGSQNACFILFNLFAGTAAEGRKKKILLPLCPEYIGYADQTIEPDCFLTRPARIVETGPGEFKYFVDFDKLEIPEDTGALCISRPTNPTGNVLTDEEVNKLSTLAGEKEIPLIIDNAYGAPFPNIIFEDVHALWNENIVLSMSLSKLGLPSARTGIVIARKEIIQALSAANAIISLATAPLGQMLTRPLMESGEILTLSRNLIRPFYQERSRNTIAYIRETFDSALDYRIHRSEGAIFLWIWFKNLSITTRELYERLKKRHVLIIPSEYFFFGLEEPWDHSEQCIRLNYSQDPDDVRKGVDIIAEEALKAVKT